MGNSIPILYNSPAKLPNRITGLGRIYIQFYIFFTYSQVTGREHFFESSYQSPQHKYVFDNQRNTASSILPII